MEDQKTEVVPIREVSRLTGVNSITLRAWERRYGLLKPQRTESGHRLYTQADIQRVKDVQAWLVRGLAVSQVKDILAQGGKAGAEAERTANEQNPWVDYFSRAEASVSRLEPGALEKLLHELVRLYPVPLLADQLIAPLLERLYLQREYGAQTRLAFLHSVAQEYFWFGINRQRQSAKGTRLLVIKLNPDESDLLPLVATYSLLINGFNAQYLGYLPLGEVIFAAERTGANGMVAHGDLAAGVPALRRQLREWQQLLRIPLFLSGKVVPVYSAGAVDEPSEVFLAEWQQTLVAAVKEACG